MGHAVTVCPSLCLSKKQKTRVRRAATSAAVDRVSPEQRQCELPARFGGWRASTCRVEQLPPRNQRGHCSGSLSPACGTDAYCRPTSSVEDLAPAGIVG
jgi:hypothetical protein